MFDFKNKSYDVKDVVNDAKTLGYNTLEEAQNAYNELEVKVKTSLDEMEAKLNAI